MGILSSQFLEEGDTHYLNNDFEKALQSYEKAREETPNNPRVYNNMANAYNKNKKYGQALESYDKALEFDRTYPGTLTAKGFCLNSMERYKEALSIFAEVLKENPQDSAAWCGKGFSLQKLGKNDDAEEAYNRAIKSGGDTKNTKEAATAGLLQLRRLKGVSTLIQENIPSSKTTKTPITTTTITTYSWLPLHQHQPEDTPNDDDHHKSLLNSYRNGLQNDPTNEELWFKVAKLLQFLGKIEDSIECYDRGLQLNGDIPAFYLGLGVALFELNRHSDASRVLQTGLELAPANVLLLINYGAVLLNLNKGHKSVELFRLAGDNLGMGSCDYLDDDDGAVKLVKSTIDGCVGYLGRDGMKREEERNRATVLSQLVMELNFFICGRVSKLTESSLENFKKKYCGQ